MAWVKGELLADLNAASVDPTAQLTRDAQPRLFDQIEWYRRVLRHAETHLQPLIVRVASEGTLGWLILARNTQGNLEALTNWYTMAFRPVFAGEPDDLRKRAMLTAIAKRLRAMRGAPGRITMQPVPRADGTSALLARAFKRSGWVVSVDQVSTSWTANVADMSFDEYWEARPGQLRSTYKRKSAKAEFDVKIYDHFDEDAWADYEAVYADSWKPEEGSPNFLRQTALYEGDAGAVRIGICRIDGQAIAAQFWTVEDGTAYIHKLAHRESVKDLSPGTILSAALFRYVIDVDHVNIIDFGTGDDDYKADWMDSSAPLDRVQAFNPASLSGLGGAARASLSSLVARVRQR
jgi:CelD/BcsL family acetyltransferase involved in cellulose biosynthesis